MSLRWHQPIGHSVRLIDDWGLIIAVVNYYEDTEDWSVRVWNHNTYNFTSVRSFDTKERGIEFINQAFGLDK